MTIHTRYQDDPNSPYRDMNGHPMDLMSWSDLFQDFQARTLLRTRVSESVEVITVWHGMDPYFFDVTEDYPEPRIFGSAILRNDKATEFAVFARKEDAEQFHERAVEHAKS